MIEAGIRTYLLSKSAITDLVGTRIHPGHIPDTTYPALSYKIVSEPHLHYLTSAAGSAKARIQIDCWSNLYSDTITMSEALRSVLSGFAGTMGSVSVTSVTLDNEIDLPEPPTDGSASWIFHRACDYMIAHRTSIPTF